MGIWWRDMNRDLLERIVVALERQATYSEQIRDFYRESHAEQRAASVKAQESADSMIHMQQRISDQLRAHVEECNKWRKQMERNEPAAVVN